MLLREDLEHVRSRLPSEPLRLLEVGCGAGELARELGGLGHDVVAVDPIAPEGAIFVRGRIEDFEADGEFDAVVALRSLHHVDRLDLAVARIEAALRPGGLLIVREFDRERLDEPTLRWLHGQQLSDVGPYEPWRARLLETWREHVLPFAEVRAAIRAGGFEELESVDGPYLYRYGLDPAVLPVERTLVAEGAIQPVGVDYTARALRR